jgi:hypothetical protein
VARGEGARGLNAMVQPLRLRPLRRLPFAFGWMSKRPVPDEVMDGWLRPALTQREVRRDLLKYLRAVGKRDTLIPEDRPVELSRVIQDFVRDTL